MIRALFAVALAATSASPARATAEPLQRAPAFALPALSGSGQVRLADYRGRVVYLDFWASWCASCAISMPGLAALAASYSNRPFVVVSVDADTVRAAGIAFRAKVHAAYPAGWDPHGSTLSAYAVPGLPTGILIDAKGRVRLRNIGFRPGEIAFLKAHVDQLLAEQALGIVRASNQ